MDSNTANTHEDALKNIIEKQVTKMFNYKQTGYFKRLKNVDRDKQSGLVNWAEYTLFDAWAKEAVQKAKEKSPPAIKNEEMPTLDHQILRNLYFGAYPNSTKAKNSIRRMVKTYRDKYHTNDTPNNCNRFSDIVDRRIIELEQRTRQNIRTQFAEISYD